MTDQIADAYADQSLLGTHVRVHFPLAGSLITGLDKSGYQVSSFLISQGKHMLWVLIRSASPRHFL